MNRDGRASGLGYVELSSSDDVPLATSMSQKNIGRHNRYANIFECEPKELAWYMDRKANGMGTGKKFRLKMQGLPFRASEYQVRRKKGIICRNAIKHEKRALKGSNYGKIVSDSVANCTRKSSILRLPNGLSPNQSAPTSRSTSIATGDPQERLLPTLIQRSW